MIWSNGIKALGKWRNGKQWNVNYYDNKGKFIGSVEKGVKLDEKRNLGVLFGRIIKGEPEWSEEKIGKYKDKYVGEIKNGKPDGEGTLYITGRRIYVGNFKDGKMNGYGIFSYPNGNRGIGEFKGTKPLNIIKYDNNGNIIGQYVNGLKQK